MGRFIEHVSGFRVMATDELLDRGQDGLNGHLSAAPATWRGGDRLQARGLPARMRELTGEGVDVGLDGIERALSLRSFRALRQDGRLVIFGSLPARSFGARPGQMDADLEAMSRRREEAHAELLARSSAVYRAFLEMERAAFADGELSKRLNQLIAVGISVVVNCESCMQWHIEQAALAGASEGEVLEALEVGIEMGGGPATAHARFALKVMAAVFEEELR